MLNARTQFVFDPQARDTTYSDFERARAEGWFGLEALSVGEESRKTCALNISEALNRAAEIGEESYNEEEENPFIEPRSAICGLRKALRAIQASLNALTGEGYASKRARDLNIEALLAISNALVSIETPE
jgi:hypothetical protein